MTAAQPITLVITWTSTRLSVDFGGEWSPRQAREVKARLEPELARYRLWLEEVEVGVDGRRVVLVARCRACGQYIYNCDCSRNLDKRMALMDRR